IASTSRDCRQDIDAVIGGDGRITAAHLAVHEDVDVAADPTALVEDPAAGRRVGALELAQQLDHRGALDRMLARPACELLQRASYADDRHYRTGSYSMCVTDGEST